MDCVFSQYFLHLPFTRSYTIVPISPLLPIPAFGILQYFILLYLFYISQLPLQTLQENTSLKVSLCISLRNPRFLLATFPLPNSS